MNKFRKKKKAKTDKPKSTWSEPKKEKRELQSALCWWRAKTEVATEAAAGSGGGKARPTTTHIQSETEESQGKTHNTAHRGGAGQLGNKTSWIAVDKHRQAKGKQKKRKVACSSIKLLDCQYVDSARSAGAEQRKKK